MTKKDYIVITKVLRDTREYMNRCFIYGDNPAMTREQEEVFSYARDIIQKVEDGLIMVLSEDNNRFCCVKFSQASKAAQKTYAIKE